MGMRYPGLEGQWHSEEESSDCLVDPRGNGWMDGQSSVQGDPVYQSLGRIDPEGSLFCFYSQS